MLARRRVRVATFEECERYGRVPRGAFPPMGGAAGPALENVLGSASAGGTSASASVACAHAVARGRLVVLFGGGRLVVGTVPSTSVADDAGNAYTTLAPDVAANGASMEMAAALIDNPLATTSHLTATAHTLNGIMVAGASFTGVTQLQPYAAATNTAPGTGDATVGSSAPVQAGDLGLLFIVAEFQGSAIPTPAGWTPIVALSGPACGCFYQVPSTTGVLSVDVPQPSSVGWGAQIVALRAGGTRLRMTV